MEFDQQKLQNLIQHYLISTVIIFFSYIALFLSKITFLFFQISRQQKIYIYIGIDDRNVSGEPLMHHEDFSGMGISIKKRGTNLYIKVNIKNGSWIILLTCTKVILRVDFLCQYDQNNNNFLYRLL